MSYDPSHDIECCTTHHKEALAGREFILQVWLSINGRLVRSEYPYKNLVETFAEALLWRGKAMWARIIDFDRKSIIGTRLMDRLWAADRGCFGSPSTETPFVVSGPTINPDFIEHYRSKTLLRAIDFASSWSDSLWDEPYWVVVCGPNGRTVLSRHVVQRIYHAEIKASGNSVTEHIIRGALFLVGAEILSTKRIV